MGTPVRELLGTFTQGVTSHVDATRLGAARRRCRSARRSRRRRTRSSTSRSSTRQRRSAEPHVLARHGARRQRLGVDREHDQLGLVADRQRQPPDRDRVHERRAGDGDVERAVELGSVGAVELAPPPVPVGAEPEVGLLEVAEQHELADLPQRRQPDDVVDPLAFDVHVRRPRLVVPVQGRAARRGRRRRRPSRRRSRRRRTSGGRPRAPVCRRRPRVAARHGYRAWRDAARGCPGVRDRHTARRRRRSTSTSSRPTGSVLAADVVAAEQVPPFDNSAVDGYAVRAADVAAAPVELGGRGRGRRRRGDRSRARRRARRSGS